MVDEGPTGVKAPDGGWGWAVLLGCFVITGFSYAFPKAVSVFFKELMREFGIGYSDTAWISSILLAMLYGTGEGPSPRVCQARLHGLVCTAMFAQPRSPRAPGPALLCVQTANTGSSCCELRFAWGLPVATLWAVGALRVC